jgi:hypothetical protein
MKTLADLERNYDDVMARLKVIRQKIADAKEGEIVDMELSSEWLELHTEANILMFNLTRHREMTDYLISSDPYGGPQ